MKIAQTSARSWGNSVGTAGSGGTETEGVAEDARFEDVLRVAEDAEADVVRAGMANRLGYRAHHFGKYSPCEECSSACPITWEEGLPQSNGGVRRRHGFRSVQKDE